MEKRTLRWYEYEVRMDLARRPKLVLEARPEEKRGKGRSRVKRGRICGRIGKKERKKVTRSETTCPG
jgi:hypothetical protein